MNNKLLAFLLCLPFDFQFLQFLENKAHGGIAIHAQFYEIHLFRGALYQFLILAAFSNEILYSYLK